LKDVYNINDYILTGKCDNRDIFTDMFKGTFDKEKYYVTRSTSDYSNGDIIITYEDIIRKTVEVRHGFTVHSLQGETIDTKIFINIKDMFDRRMLYTAISRARKFNQLYLII
jgi:hypothetical protein